MVLYRSRSTGKWLETIGEIGKKRRVSQSSSEWSASRLSGHIPIHGGMNSQTRLAELLGKDELTAAEMQEVIDLGESGDILSLPSLHSIGTDDIDRAIKNLSEIAGRTGYAIEQGCYLEAISLRLQLIEFWLRLYYVAANGKGKIFALYDRRTFGKIVHDCAQLGFEPALINRLSEFNKRRIDAIHKYILGATDYDELQRVCEQSAVLPDQVCDYVGRKIGLPLK